MIATAALLAAALQVAAPPHQAEEIVVTAIRGGGCRVTLADRTLTSRQLAANATRWAAAGNPVRVVRPTGAGYACLARIARNLNRYGVTLIEFVDRPPRR